MRLGTGFDNRARLCLTLALHRVQCVPRLLSSECSACVRAGVHAHVLHYIGAAARLLCPGVQHLTCV
eukprot:4436637-Prymnesium_polylepis.1